MLHFLVILAILNTAFAQPNTCHTTPWDSACADYTYPDANVTSDITALCSAMWYMPGCTILNVCAESSTKNDPDPYCENFSVLADICEYDMPKMSGCKSYVGLCAPANSTAPQCNAHPSIPDLPTTDEANTAIKSMCGQHFMDGCQNCDISVSGFMQCDLLSVYSQLCLGMPDMVECAQWKLMCQAIPDWSEFCPSDDPSDNQPPVMRMYFHTGFKDYVLFEQWVPRTSGEYAGTVIAIIILGIIYEAIQTLQSYMEWQWRYPKEDGTGKVTEIDPLNNNANLKLIWGKVPFRPLIDMQRALLHVVHVIVGYALMLIAMTFNVGLFFAVLTGMGLGNFFFARFRGLSTKSTCCE